MKLPAADDAGQTHVCVHACCFEVVDCILARGRDRNEINRTCVADLHLLRKQTPSKLLGKDTRTEAGKTQIKIT